MQLLTNNMELIKQQYEEKRKALERAREEYWNAMNAVPNRPTLKGWFGNFLGSLWGVVTASINVIGCIFGSCSRPPEPIDNTAFENAMAYAKLKLEELKRAEAEHDEWFQKKLAEQYKLAAIIHQLNMLDLDKIEPQEIIEILKKAFMEANNLKKHWSYVVRFFVSVSIQADSTKELIGSRFVSLIEEAMSANIALSDEDREFFVELVLIAAEDIDQNAALLYTMAKTYFDISTTYMINQVSGMGHLIAISDVEERRQALNLLKNDTLVTSTNVANMVQQRQLAYKLRQRDRQAILENYIRNMTLHELQATIG